jgi:hypothetical protein
VLLGFTALGLAVETMRNGLKKKTLFTPSLRKMGLSLSRLGIMRMTPILSTIGGKVQKRSPTKRKLKRYKNKSQPSLKKKQGMPHKARASRMLSISSRVVIKMKNFYLRRL